MNSIRTKYAVGALLLCALSAPLLKAQDGKDGPPNILVINREFTKPGRTGSAHEKTESGFIAAAKANKAPFHYLGMTSMTGPDRALFFSGYSSLAAWEEENKAEEKIPALGPALDHAMLADGDLLSATDASTWMRRDDLSLNNGGLLGARYMEIEQIGVKPGHQAEFDELGKMFINGFKKIPGAHWTIFQQIYGINANGFIVVTTLKSLADADVEWGSFKTFEATLGPAGVKKLNDLMAACVETDQVNLFHFDPKMSLPPAEWIAAEPDYWTPKHTSASVKKSVAPEKK